MANRYGHADDPGISGGPWSRTPSAAPVASAAAPPRFAANLDGDAYPQRYLRAGWRQRLERTRAMAARTATVPRSILFPILILLMISVTVRPEGNSQDLDWQVFVRIGGYALAGLVVLFALGRGKLRLSTMILAWVPVPIYIIVTSLYAPEPMFSLTAGLAHLALLLFAWYMVSRFGQSRTILALVLTGLAIGTMSIFAFYFVPDLGRSTADLLSGDLGGRMRGVAAQANSLGSLSALTVLLAVMHFKLFSPRQRILAAAAIVVAGFCLVASDSRTSILALMLCLGLWGLCRANAALNLFGVVGIALLACLVIGFVPDVTAMLSRQGAGADDFSSFNGRSRIWSVAWEYIEAHPIFGQGYGASRAILPFDDRLFTAAVHAHNVYLELLFSGGAIALGLYVVGVFLAVGRSATRRRVEALIALLFFLIVGVTEATPYAGLPLFQAFVFYVAISLCLAPSRPRVPAPQPGRVGARPAPTPALHPSYGGLGPRR